MNTEARDRAFDRYVIIHLKDKARLESILDTIPRTDVCKHCNHIGTKATYVLKVKKQELLMIKLSIEVYSTEKIRPRKKAYKSLKL